MLKPTLTLVFLMLCTTFFAQKPVFTGVLQETEDYKILQKQQNQTVNGCTSDLYKCQEDRLIQTYTSYINKLVVPN